MNKTLDDILEEKQLAKRQREALWGLVVMLVVVAVGLLVW